MKKNLLPKGSAWLLRNNFLLPFIPIVLLSIFFNKTLVAQCSSPIVTFPYSEGFETSASWTIGGSNSSWAWGIPGHPTISSAAGGSKCWCSGGLTGSSYTGAQQSWIESPCFNFSTLNYPWISFKLFWECEYTWDGLVFQYSINGGSTWANVGSVTDPVNCLNANWFNYSNISNLTLANPKHGWCGRIGATSGSCAGGNGSAAWVTVKHCLTNLANQSSVKFRFLFGSGTTCNSYDGIAIDDILIQDAPPNAANFSYNCGGSNIITFTNLSGQCPTAYSWNFGDPASASTNTSTLQNPSHTFSSPGTYTVSLTSSGPCNASSTTLIPVSILSLSAISSTLSCNGMNNGSSTVNVNGGIPAYSYTWLPSGGNGSVAVGLSSGAYTVLVQDISNCVKSLTTNISQPPAIAANISQANVSCFSLSDASLSASASMGSPPYSYTWYPMGIVSSSINGLAPGAYSLTIKDANNCLATINTTVTQPQGLSIGFSLKNISCFGGNDGTVTAICNGGTPGYSYTWSPSSATSSFITGLGTGTYSIAVRDANNCFASSVIFMNQPASAIAGSILTNTPTCGSANGSATVLAVGGTAGYSYSWSPAGSTFSTVSGLAGGLYSVSITDTENCSTTLTTNIFPSTSVSLSVNTNNSSCNNLSNGSASATAIGGIAPYTYTWFPVPGSGQGNSTVNGLTIGNYSIHVSDVNNCIVSSVFSITSPPPLSFVYNTNNVSCYGGNNGSISLVASGGTPSYSFSCSPPGSTGTSINNLSVGNYTVILKDHNNCAVNSIVQVFQPLTALSAVISHTNIQCYGFSNGALNVVAGGGTPGYSYTWSPVGGNLAGATGLSAGNYSLLIKDANNCNYSSTLLLTQPLQPLTGSVFTSSISCFGGINGGATLTPIGGTPGYTFSWPAFAGNVNFANSLPAENYSVLVMDLNNCISTVTFSIIQPPPIIISTSASKFCSGQPGILSANINGGMSPFIYNWNGTQSSSGAISFTLNSSTVYTVFATDVKGCVSNKTNVAINIPSPLKLITSPNYSVCEGQNILVTANAAGGDGNYLFLWQPGNMRGPIQNILPIAGQVYTVSVTDGCATKQSGNAELNFYPVPKSDITYTYKAGCSPVCVTFSNTSLVASGLVQSFQWNFGDSSVSDLKSPSHCFIAEGNHFVQFNYSTINGCFGSQILKDTIQVYPKPLASFTTDGEKIDTYYPTANFTNQSKGATYYNWLFNSEGSSPDENPSFTFLNPGEQLVILMAQNDYGCSDTAIKKIKIEAEFTFFAPNAFSPNDNNINDIFLPKGIGWNTAKYELVIYDRWGEKIFSTKNYDEGWNGKIKEKDSHIQNGIYTWKVMMYDMFNKYHEFIGNVLIQK